ncbi:TraB/GumN family protein [Tabrizicola sp. J26]|uniref:TraB/GumN family protein n=1 Tax=Alitabrizicola rongguiensis TaxID=2909234 RepID=UPI001F40C82D|nr:TraB/GumN family protein [Tabrizicola rongguiensis]MCF1710490.1 TraB/GumN family protein [Tabrizicola rongguiensis]
MRLLIAGLLALLPLSPAFAACNGQDQLAALPPATQAELQSAADAAPFARGNYWRATRGDEVVTLLGTVHIDDPRLDAVVAAALPDLKTSTVLLVEAGPEEQAKLQKALASDPSLMFITEGPTLAERLPGADWQTLKAAFAARGVPAFLGAKMQPAYVSLVLSIPPCATEMMQGNGNGLDQRLIGRAQAQDIPIRALEPFDTVFKLIRAMPSDDQIEMLEMSIALEDQAADSFATLLQAYFAENARLMWEFSLWQSAQTPGMTPERARAEAQQMDEMLMSGRNRAWIPVIEAAAKEGAVFAAFGALHLAGPEGVLALLQQQGFAIERLPFPSP